MRSSGPIFAFFVVGLVVMSAVSGTPRAENGLVLRGTETRVTNAAADQFDPAISGNLVVYTDFSGVDADVWYTDLSTGVAAPVATGSGDQQLTGVSGSRVVYTDWYAMDVMVFDAVTKETTNLTNAAFSNSVDPAIGGTLVAWTDDRDGNAEIYAKDLATGEERRITNDLLIDEAPAVGNGIIAWERCDLYCCDVFAYDWAAATTRQLTATPNASERLPDVYGRTVVFQREQGTPIDKNVVAVDLDTGTERVLELPGDQENAHISGPCVVFNDSGSGLSHIGLWDLATGNHFEVTSGPGGQYLNDIDGNRIVYSDSRNDGNLDIYMYEFQILSPPPSISVNPQSLNFGDVEIGTSRQMLVTLSNTGTADLTLDSVLLAPEGGTAFSIPQAPQSPIAPGASADVGVIFAPTAPGAVAGTLQITSNDPVHGTVEVALAGAGVLADVPPEQQVEAILQFLDSSVTKGTLIGSGPGKSAGNRLNALRNMLAAVGDLIRKGNTAGACQQLSDAYLKTDGQPQPPDFVTGTAAAELAQMIRTLMTSL